MRFVPIETSVPSVGLAMQTETDGRFLRVTHIFQRSIYAIWVDDAAGARRATRPQPYSRHELQQLAPAGVCAWGRLELPPAFTAAHADGRDQVSIEAAWRLIEPLIAAFESENNLGRNRFSKLIEEHARTREIPFISLHRLVLRYYYFGCSQLALLSLPRGPKPGAVKAPHNTDADGEPIRAKRRGRQATYAEEFGGNSFVVSEDDVEDMVQAWKSALRKGPAYETIEHEKYLASGFRRRNPELHASYLAGRAPEPVSLRQFRYYLGKSRLDLDARSLRNQRSTARKPGYQASLHAAGPGEVYEIDATGGRLHLVAAGDPPVLVSRPTIYLIIDRWSRFIVSIYISLKAPSYEEVRFALLVAFTSRERRFRALGIDVDDVRWPVGRVPAVICPDRGSDFMSMQFQRAVAEQLRIEVTPLPPLTPDGKAIVERMIREIKRRMAGSALKGTYADRPLDPTSRKAARQAEAAAVHSLPEAYRSLVEIVVDHNNRPHASLKRRKALIQAGIPPTPQAAYEWGLQAITGMKSPPFSDTDYQRMLLAVEPAKMVAGTIRFRNRTYQPTNAAAESLVALSAKSARSCEVRVDRTDPCELYVSLPSGGWAEFTISAGGARELAGSTLDEEEVMASFGASLAARADQASRRGRVAHMSQKDRSPKRAAASPARGTRAETHAAKTRETLNLKGHLLNAAPSKKQNAHPATPAKASRPANPDEIVRLRQIEMIRKRRTGS